MANGTASPKAPNTSAPVGQLGTKGRRDSGVVKTGRPETRSDRKVNEKSSENTPNLSRQNQSRS